MKNDLKIIFIYIGLFTLLGGCGGGGGSTTDPVMEGQINCATDNNEPLQGCWVSMCVKVNNVPEDIYSQYVMNFDSSNKLKINLRTFTNSQCSGSDFRLGVVNDQSYLIGAVMVDETVYLEKNLNIKLAEVTGGTELFTRYGIESDQMLCFPAMEFNWSGDLGGYSPLATAETFRPTTIDYTAENCLVRLIE